MGNTAVLRFRDFETKTVEVHRQIINQTGAVWWAWWKKESEDGKLEVLEELARACPLDVGLVNRLTDTRFVARCTRVAYSVDGTPLSTPEPARTPVYYRQDSFPAWFLFSSVESVRSDDWDRRFGGVPVGEPTLFLIPTNSADQARALLTEKPTRKPISIRSPVILHLSDLHFGSDYGFPLRRREVPTLQQTLDETIGQGLVRMGSPPIGLLIISGDITTRGEGNGFLEAQSFLSSLLPRLHLSSDQVVIVPGNHDILLDDRQLTRNYSSEQPFRNFLNLVYGSNELELNRLHWFSSPEKDIIILALNSIRPRAETTMEYGYIGRDLYGPLVDEAGRLNSEIQSKQGIPPISMAVLHDHVLPTPLVEDPDPQARRPISLTLDAGQLIEDLQRANVGMILHAHQHVPFVGSTSRGCRNQNGDWTMAHPVYVIGGGSCSVKVDRLWNQMRNNSLGVYVPRQDEMTIGVFQFAPGVEFQEMMKLSIPL